MVKSPGSKQKQNMDKIEQMIPNWIIGPKIKIIVNIQGEV